VRPLLALDYHGSKKATSATAASIEGLSKPSVNQAVHRHEEIASFRVFGYSLHTSDMSMAGATDMTG